jgi:hypothetical protein
MSNRSEKTQNDQGAERRADTQNAGAVKSTPATTVNEVGARTTKVSRQKSGTPQRAGQYLSIATLNGTRS